MKKKINSDAFKKTALITGVTGQDGAYLAEFLLDRIYSSCNQTKKFNNKTDRIDHLFKDPHKTDVSFSSLWRHDRFYEFD